MIMSSQGFGHFTRKLNNQDFGIETSRMIMILDGCSDAEYSEVGTRLFAQLFSRKEECDKVEKFEDNVKNVFEDIIEMMRKYYPDEKDLKNEFIMKNLLFTIIACFETENEYIVKIFGDGYIITQNNRKLVSYLKFTYGKRPPYFAYKYCDLPKYKNYQFKTFTFDKKVFPKIAIATDGIVPIVRGNVNISDNEIISGNKATIEVDIKQQIHFFVDDITIATFGGEK